MSIGKRISDARKDKGFTQEYIAEKLNVSRQAVSKWEKDQSAPDTRNLIALAELLCVSVEYLAVGKRMEQAHPSASGKAFYLSCLIPLTVMVVCHFIGLLSGEYTDMVMIPVSSGMRIGIPFLLYGKSPMAIGLLIVSIVCLLLFILLLFLGHYTNKHKK